MTMIIIISVVAGVVVFAGSVIAYFVWKFLKAKKVPTVTVKQELQNSSQIVMANHHPLPELGKQQAA